MIGLGVPAERVSVVSNTPRTDGAASPAHAGAQPPVRSYLQLVYAGFVQEGRGLETAVRALPLAHARGVDVRLRVVGDGTYMNQLKALVRELRLERAVEFTGWVSPADVTRHIEQADIGVIPHPKHAHTDTTIPNKLFDYMAGAKPVIVSNAAPMERIVRAEACGLVFVAGDAESFAEQLACLSADAAGRRTMGQNGARAVRERFNWQRDAAVLRGAVAAVVRAS